MGSSYQEFYNLHTQTRAPFPLLQAANRAGAASVGTLNAGLTWGEKHIRQPEGG